MKDLYRKERLALYCLYGRHHVRRLARKCKKERTKVLYVFLCRSCWTKTADPDRMLDCANYCPRCRSGAGSDYHKADRFDVFAFRHDFSSVYWRDLGYADTTKAALFAELAALKTDRKDSDA